MTLILEMVGHRPLTANEHRRLVPYERARKDKGYREFGHWYALKYKWPKLTQVDVTVLPLHKDARSPQDAGACAPAVKGLLDGLVDAGVLEDDGPKFVRSLLFLAPEVCGVDGLRMTLTPAQVAA